MIFRYNRYNDNFNNGFYIKGKQLKKVSEVTYLGIILNDRLCNASDMKRSLNSFYRSFNVILRRFYYCDKNILFYLFKLHCLSFYGSELWIDFNGCSVLFRQFELAYHNSIKKLLSVSKYESNHDVCEYVSMFTFKHFINFKKLNFFEHF